MQVTVGRYSGFDMGFSIEAKIEVIGKYVETVFLAVGPVQICDGSAAAGNFHPVIICALGAVTKDIYNIYRRYSACHAGSGC